MGKPPCVFDKVLHDQGRVFKAIDLQEEREASVEVCPRSVAHELPGLLVISKVSDVRSVGRRAGVYDIRIAV